MANIGKSKPDTHTKTNKVSVQTRKQGDKIVVTTGKCGGAGKGKAGGRFGGKTTVG